MERRLLALALCLILAACGPGPSPTAVVTRSPPPVTFVPPLTPVPLRTAIPTPRPGRTLTVCTSSEPDTLYIYGESSLAASHVWAAIYGGPIETVSYAYRPVILEKVPALADGDAAIRVVTAGPGDVVVEDGGYPVELVEHPSPTIRLRPAGCHAADCAIDYVSGTVPMEQMVVTFTLRAGLAWADGTPVTAADSVYSFGLYSDPDTPLPADHDWYGNRTFSYEAFDSQVVVWTGLPGLRDTYYFANFWQPLPQHRLGHMTAAEACCESEEGMRKPMGYGPYTTAEWAAGDHITVVRNPHYFGAGEERPYFDQIVYRFIPEDPEAAIAALLAGECDVLTQDFSFDLQMAALLELEGQGRLRLHTTPGTAFEHLDFCIDPVASYERPDFFSDARMRRAVALCLDRQAVVDALFHGRSVVPDSYVAAVHPLYEPTLEPLLYDPPAGQALLEELGWRDADGDGVREAHGVAGIADGTPLSFKWQSTTAALRVSYMQLFQADLRECGFDVVLDNMPSTEYFANDPDGPLWGRRFDVASFTSLTGVEPPCDLYLCDQVPTEGNGWAGQNDIGYCNPAFDAACHAALEALPGTPQYERYHREAQHIWAADLPSLPLYVRIKVCVSRPDLQGLLLDPTASTEMWNVAEFRLGP